MFSFFSVIEKCGNTESHHPVLLPWDLTALPWSPAPLSPHCMFDIEARLDANYHQNHISLCSALLPKSSLSCFFHGLKSHSSTVVNGAFLIWMVKAMVNSRWSISPSGKYLWSFACRNTTLILQIFKTLLCISFSSLKSLNYFPLVTQYRYRCKGKTPYPSVL